MVSDVIKKYAYLMYQLPYDIGTGAQILVKEGEIVYGTSKGCSFKRLLDKDINNLTDTVFPEIKALLKIKKAGAMIVCKTPFVGAAIDGNRSIFAVLDDMAQIVGHKVSLVNYNEMAIRYGLSQSCAVMIKDGYCLVIGRNLYEAYVAMTVLEKSAEVFFKAEIIGGAKKINSAEARLMRLVYLKKYSSSERKYKDESEG